VTVGLLEEHEARARVAKAASHPLRVQIMKRLLNSEDAMCATEIGTALFGEQFDGQKGSSILWHLRYLESTGFVEFSHTGKPPKWGKPMLYFVPTSLGRKSWDVKALRSALTEVERDRLKSRRGAHEADASAEQVAAVLGSMAHPLAVRGLRKWKELGEASTKEVAAELGVGYHAVAYHVRKLVDVGLLELVDTDIRKGGTIKYFEPKLPEWAERALLAEAA
jgi:DNA-binding transcriptional ArsR family regulator